MITEPTLGLVVIGYNSQDQWESFFESLGGSTLQPGHAVVVDNSPRGSPAVDTKLWSGMVLERLLDNPGYGSAVNFGISLLPPEVSHVVVSNPDVRFTSDALSTLVESFMTFDQTALVGPGLINADGTIYPSARAIPGLRIGIGHALLGNAWPANPWTRKYLGDYRTAVRRPVGWLSGALCLINRQTFLEVGGFDEGYFMFFEDVDLCHRLKRAGYRTVYVPDALVHHEGGNSTNSRMVEMVKAHHESAVRFLSKLYPHEFQKPLLLALRLGLAVRSRIQQAKYRRLARKIIEEVS